VCRDQSAELFAWLSGWDLEVRTNNTWARRTPAEQWQLDVTVGEGTETLWIYRRDPLVTRPWHEAVLFSESGVPYLAPDIQLLFKSKDRRSKDDVDAAQVIPGLTSEELEFLSNHLAADHPWRELFPN
jgi:hypothetical protein